MHFMPTFHDNQWLTKNIFINSKEYTEGWVNMPRAAGDKQETQTFYRGYWDWAADFAFSFLFRACGEMFCLWWKVCLSPSSNIYLAQLLSRFWYRQYSERGVIYIMTEHGNFSLNSICQFMYRFHREGNMSPW